MSTAIATKQEVSIIEQVIVKGDLAKLTPDERMGYYKAVCESVGLNPFTKPFEYITLNGKLTLYARKDATDQLRSLRGVSLTIVSRERVDDVYVVTARATMPDGRTDESIGAVALGSLKGEAYANAIMKAETKAKRRVTLSVCGLGMLDENEVETIPDARPEPAAAHAPALPPPPPDEPATDEQIEMIGKLIEGLAFHKVPDEKLLAGINALAKVNGSQCRLSSLDDLTPLDKMTAANVIDVYSAKLDKFDEAAKAQA
jgi:hypothetical protein